MTVYIKTCCVNFIYSHQLLLYQNVSQLCVKQYALPMRSEVPLQHDIFCQQILTTCIPWLAHEGEARAVFHDFTIWPIYYCHYCRGDYDITKHWIRAVKVHECIYMSEHVAHTHTYCHYDNNIPLTNHMWQPRQYALPICNEVPL